MKKINKAGVTLVEVMISMVILLVVFMGLIQASLLSINHNMRNSARDEAVRIGAESMARLRSFNYNCGELDSTANVPLINGSYNPADNYANCGRTAAVPSDQKTAMNTPTGSFRNLSITYTVTKTVDWLEVVVAPKTQPNAKRLMIRVEWIYPGETETQQHSIYYTMRNPAP